MSGTILQLRFKSVRSIAKKNLTGYIYNWTLLKYRIRQWVELKSMIK